MIAIDLKLKENNVLTIHEESIPAFYRVFAQNSITKKKFDDYMGYETLRHIINTKTKIQFSRYLRMQNKCTICGSYILTDRCHYCETK